MTLFRPLHPRLARFARAMTGDDEAARDLVHDTVLIAFEGFERVKDHKAFLSFLFTIASRTYGKQKRRTKWFGGYDEDHAESIRDPRAMPDDSADVALLYDALALLPAAQREAVVLFEISGLPLEEIRNIQGGSLSGVKSRLVRGRGRLAELLGADADDRANITVPTAGTPSSSDAYVIPDIKARGRTGKESVPTNVISIQLFDADQ